MYGPIMLQVAAASPHLLNRSVPGAILLEELEVSMPQQRQQHHELRPAASEYVPWLNWPVQFRPVILPQWRIHHVFHWLGEAQDITAYDGEWSHPAPVASHDAQWPTQWWTSTRRCLWKPSCQASSSKSTSTSVCSAVGWWTARAAIYKEWLAALTGPSQQGCSEAKSAWDTAKVADV